MYRVLRLIASASTLATLLVACSPAPAEVKTGAVMSALREQSAPPVVGQSSEAVPFLENWPQWRGPLGTGEAPNTTPPRKWSEEQNVRWKTFMPGLGHSTPVVWGDRLFLTSAEPQGEPLEAVPEIAEGGHDNTPVTRRQRYLALCVSRATGEVLWQTSVHEDLPHQGHHDSATFASPSPVTDGEHLFVSFGSRGLFCLDLDGDVFWRAQPGAMKAKHGHGEGASPALFGETVVINLDHEGQSRLIAYEKGTGEVRWQVDRDEPTSWSSPIIVEVEGKPQVIVAAANKVCGYDLEDGALIWQCGGLTHNVVATPLVADGVVYAGSSYGPQAMMALKLEGARGDLDESDHLLWYRRRSTPYVPSPLLYRGTLYFLNHYQGFLCCVDAATGRDRHRPLRVDSVGNVYASPIAAGGCIYLVGRDGATLVLDTQSPPQPVALNSLNDSFSASPVVVGDELYLRGESYLYCIGVPPEPPK